MRTGMVVPVVVILASVASVSACDRSWREENFRLPTAGEQGGGAVAPPRPGTTGPDFTGDTRSGSDASVRDGGIGGEDDAGGGSDQDASANPVEADAGEQHPKPDDETGEPAVREFSKRLLLTAAADCAMEQYSGFAASAQTLAQAVNKLDTVPTDAELDAAQTAFAQAMARFQVVEQFRVGPAARGMDPGGQDLRDWIYSFPLVNRCQVDRNLVSEAYATDFESVLLNARGLATLEYLLFYRGSENACSAGIDINSRATWSELSHAELEARRIEYAKVVASDILLRAQVLVDAWDADGDNFREQLAQAGDGSELFTSQQAALNALSHALFYIEKEVKDYKLGWPLGIVAECTTGHCPEASESPYARLSASNIASNIKGFRLLFQGCGDDYRGVGFDDWLTAVDPDGDLAQRMLDGLDQAEQAVSRLTRPLEDAFYDSPAEALAIHSAIKRITDPLKTEFVTVLNLDLPMTAEGDND